MHVLESGVILHEQQSLADQVYARLKHEILSGELKGGMKIPEELLSEQFGVSRTPVREAIRRLSEYGLVTIVPRSHCFVTLVTEKEADDIAKVRIALERLAIDGIDQKSYFAHVEDLSRYAATCQYANDIGDRATVLEQDSLFHITLIKASRNASLLGIYQRLDAKIQQLRIVQNLSDSVLAYYLTQHSQMMALLKNGKKEACKALITDHIYHKRPQDTTKS